MELRHRILQINNSPKFRLLKRELEKLGCAYKFNENGQHSSIEYTFSEQDQYAPRLKEFVISHDITIQSALYYEENEILASEWVIAEVGEFQYPQPEKHFGYREATYNLQNYCRRCGQGAIQVRPFRLAKDFIQKRAHFLGLHWVFDEIFIRPIVKTVFDGAGISGLTYLGVIEHGSDSYFDNVLQINIPISNEPGLITDDLFKVTCKPMNEESYAKGFSEFMDKPGTIFCGRVKYRYPLTKPVIFKASVLKDAPDFVKSHEYYGSMAGAEHFILVRNKVVRLVKEKGLRGLGFRRPVHLV
jgi:hypothetical protein